MLTVRACRLAAKSATPKCIASRRRLAWAIASTFAIPRAVSISTSMPMRCGMRRGGAARGAGGRGGGGGGGGGWGGGRRGGGGGGGGGGLAGGGGAQEEGTRPPH